MTISVPAARIRETVATIREELNKSLDRVRVTRETVKANPELYTRSAVTRAERGWTRVVIEETVWAIAKCGLLHSAEEAAVVNAAKAWAKSWEDLDDLAEAEPEDRALYDAVQALASALDTDSLYEAV